MLKKGGKQINKKRYWNVIDIESEACTGCSIGPRGKGVKCGTIEFWTCGTSVQIRTVPIMS